MTKGTTGQERQNSPTHTIQYKKEEEKMSKKIWSRIIVKKKKEGRKFQRNHPFFILYWPPRLKHMEKEEEEDH